MCTATEHPALIRFRTASAMRRAIVAGATSASFLAVPAAAIDVIPEEFAAHDREERESILIGSVEEAGPDPLFDYAELPTSEVAAGAPEALGVTPLPEGGGLVMLTSGVAAVCLMRRRRRAENAQSARDEVDAGDRVARVVGRQDETDSGEVDRRMANDVASGLLA